MKSQLILLEINSGKFPVQNVFISFNYNKDRARSRHEFCIKSRLNFSIQNPSLLLYPRVYQRTGVPTLHHPISKTEVLQKSQFRKSITINIDSILLQHRKFHFRFVQSGHSFVLAFAINFISAYLQCILFYCSSFFLFLLLFSWFRYISVLSKKKIIYIKKVSCQCIVYLIKHIYIMYNFLLMLLFLIKLVFWCGSKWHKKYIS